MHAPSCAGPRTLFVFVSRAAKAPGGARLSVATKTNIKDIFRSIWLLLAFMTFAAFYFCSDQTTLFKMAAEIWQHFKATWFIYPRDHKYFLSTPGSSKCLHHRTFAQITTAYLYLFYSTWMQFKDEYALINKLCKIGFTFNYMVLGLHPANERRRYEVTPSLISWAQTKNQPCNFWR